MKKQNHHFHMVNMSPWPIFSAMAAMMLLLSLIKWFETKHYTMIFFSLTVLIMIMFLWWRDVAREATYMGLHTKNTVSALQMGMLLFILSEVMLFFSFFWAFFNTSLNPTQFIGLTWPPSGIQTFNFMLIPLLNTLILLSSGITVTVAHHALMSSNNMSQANMYMTITILLGTYFSLIQMMEYKEASFSIADSAFGSCFFIATGFHGMHVLIGTLFLLYTLIRMKKTHFSNSHHVGMEASIWYWHFVDVIWLFLYVSIYWWGS